MEKFNGLWYPDGNQLTKNFKARAEKEPFYRADRFHDAMKHVRHWRGAVECGAHVGEWSRELAKRFERVVAIEMHSATAKCLQLNLADCAATVVQCALGDSYECVSIKTDKGSIGTCVGRLGNDAYTKRLDDVLLDINDLNDPDNELPVDYLKVHVNGYELRVLRGARQTIRRHRPVMTVVIKKALANYGTTPEEIFNFMDGVGYRVASCLKPYWMFVPR